MFERFLDEWPVQMRYQNGLINSKLESVWGSIFIPPVAFHSKNKRGKVQKQISFTVYGLGLDMQICNLEENANMNEKIQCGNKTADAASSST